MKKSFSKFLKNPDIFAIKIIFYLSFYYSSVLIYLTLDIVQSVDFQKYYSYFEYYSGNIDKTNLEQGNLYFFTNYLVTLLLNQIKTSLSLNELLNLSIHFTNSVIFLFGCKGLLKYLTSHKYSIKNIYIVLSIICIMPSSVALRASFKPEIVAFASIGWLLYFTNLYIEKKNSYEAIRLAILSSILLTSKISLALIIGSLMFLEIFINRKKINIKIFGIPLLFIIIFASTLTFENYRNNGLYIFETVHDEKYDNVASLKFFTNFESKDFIDNPNKYFFSDSFIGIVMFDTFNDFFGLNWNSEYTELNKSRKQFFSVERDLSNSIFPLEITFDKTNISFTISGDVDSRWRDPKYIDELRMRSSFYFSSVFYFLLILFSIFKRDQRIFLVAPFLGLAFLIISSLGIFGVNNFDPAVGDSFKTFYIAYLIIFSFSILFLEILSINKFKKILIFSTPLLFLFYLGFPMDHNQQEEIDILYKNSLLPTCNINGLLVTDLLNVEEEIKCYTITDEKEKFYPMTKVKNIDLTLIKIPYMNILFLLMLFILSSNQSKLFILNKKFNL